MNIAQPISIYTTLRDGTIMSINGLENVENYTLYPTSRPELHITFANGKHYYIGIAPKIPIDGYMANTDCVYVEIRFNDGTFFKMDGNIDLAKLLDILCGRMVRKMATPNNENDI